MREANGRYILARVMIGGGDQALMMSVAKDIDRH